MVFECCNCGKSFEPRSSRGRRRKFCESCRPANYELKPVKPVASKSRFAARACARCGVEMLLDGGRGRPRKFCESCTGCYVRPDRANDEYRAWKRDYDRARYQPKLTEFKCDQCRTSFTAVSNGGNRFCSALCRESWRRENVKYSKPKRPKTCQVCGNTFETRTKTTEFCSMICVGISHRQNPDSLQGKGHRERAFRFGVEYDNAVTRLTVLNRDNWMCGLCGEAIPHDAEYPAREYGSLDHIVPLSKGGAHVWDNVQAAHLGCNIAKGADDACWTAEEAA